ncbi:MAG: glycosyltransferase [Fimbriimonadaceae bacterium]|nr:glycosyltransferase [Fimbriimonadaceae bacterium]
MAVRNEGCLSLPESMPSAVEHVQLSVCLITYNHTRYIEGAIQSVLSQRLNVPWELIISDDCSTDGTPEIVRRYAAQHPNLIRPVLHERNLGSSAHLIELFRMARGEFIGYLEGDDRYTDENKLQLQLDYLQVHPECAGCFHDLTVVDEKDDMVAPSFLTAQGSNFRSVVEQEHLLKSGEIGQMNSWVFRRRCIEDLPRWVADFPLDKSLAFYFAEFGGWGYLSRRMSIYRLHPGGVYSPAPTHQQNQLLLRQAKILYGVPEYKAKYGEMMRLKICHYCLELARAYGPAVGRRYWKCLFDYFRYQPRKISALKVLVAEELFPRVRPR